MGAEDGWPTEEHEEYIELYGGPCDGRLVTKKQAPNIGPDTKTIIVPHPLGKRFGRCVYDRAVWVCPKYPTGKLKLVYSHMMGEPSHQGGG